MLILSGIFICFNSVKEPDIKINEPNIKLKEIQPVLDFAEKYRAENNKYPDSVDIKLKRGEYKYKATDNSNCFEIEYTYKNTQKNYGCCKLNTKDSNSKSETYSQITK